MGHHEGSIGISGELGAKVIKHGLIKRQFNKMRKQRNLTNFKEIDLKQIMRG